MAGPITTACAAGLGASAHALAQIAEQAGVTGNPAASAVVGVGSGIEASRGAEDLARGTGASAVDAILIIQHALGIAVSTGIAALDLGADAARGAAGAGGAGACSGHAPGPEGAAVGAGAAILGVGLQVIAAIFALREARAPAGVRQIGTGSSIAVLRPGAGVAARSTIRMIGGWVDALAGAIDLTGGTGKAIGSAVGTPAVSPAITASTGWVAWPTGDAGRLHAHLGVLADDPTCAAVGGVLGRIGAFAGAILHRAGAGWAAAIRARASEWTHRAALPAVEWVGGQIDAGQIASGEPNRADPYHPAGARRHPGAGLSRRHHLGQAWARLPRRAR